MKTDTYSKIVLTVIAFLLVALVMRPSAQSVHAAAAAKYSYGWYRSGGFDKSAMDDTMKYLEQESNAGCEVITALPIAGTRVDNVAMGTVNILYICRKPQ